MKVRVHFTDSAMGIFVFSGAGTTRIGDQSFRSVAMSKRKADMFRKVFHEEEEYDIEPFFLVPTKLRNIRVLDFLGDEWENDTVARLREDLRVECLEEVVS
jgi:hypothetical protein